MFFTIRDMALNADTFIDQTAKNAKICVLFHRVTPGEQVLDEYLKEHYNHGLVTMSLWLLTQCKYMKNRSNEITVLFKTAFANQLASLITYGTGTMPGSNILADAFMRT